MTDSTEPNVQKTTTISDTIQQLEKFLDELKAYQQLNPNANINTYMADEAGETTPLDNVKFQLIYNNDDPDVYNQRDTYKDIENDADMVQLSFVVSS